MADVDNGGGDAQTITESDSVAAALGNASDTTRAAGEGFLAAPAEADASDWKPPQARADGVAVDADGLPLNLRLRALALAQAGKAEDKGGILSPADIADAAGRIAAHEEAYPPIPSNAKTADLEALAGDSVDLSGAKTNEERAQLINAARPALV